MQGSALQGKTVSKAEEIVQGTEDEPMVETLKRRLKASERTIRKYQAAAQLVADAIDSAIDQPIRMPAPPKPKSQGKGQEERYGIQLTDTQWGQKTPTFDTLVAQERLDDYQDKILQHVRTRKASAKIKTAHVWFTGDMVEGETIYPGQVHHIDAPVIVQAFSAAEAYARFVIGLLNEFETIHLSCVPGNHGRIGRKHEGIHPQSNWDNVIYHLVQRLIHGIESAPHAEYRKRIKINISADAWHHVDYIWDWGCMLFHGDKGIKGSAGKPWYGLNKRISGWAETLEMENASPYDYAFFGHFHTPASEVLNSREWFCGGSLASGSHYAKSELGASGYPCQRLFVFNKDHGIIDEAKFWLTEGLTRLPARRRHERWT